MFGTVNLAGEGREGEEGEEEEGEEEEGEGEGEGKAASAASSLATITACIILSLLPLSSASCLRSSIRSSPPSPLPCSSTTASVICTSPNPASARHTSSAETCHPPISTTVLSGSVYVGGERHGNKGYFIQPTLFTNVTSELKLVQEEIFAPEPTKFVGWIERFSVNSDSQLPPRLHLHSTAAESKFTAPVVWQKQTPHALPASPPLASPSDPPAPKSIR
ncbi:hypothetical protein D9615_010204 [Tricholomella constricta]|uniref:Aldehyde dehydrogenase domain-containing protein n=1 Tax=Tricholomella constricta TaxID=117010 RepID=A0A8H5GNU9_9AGAR|nr:hypothetical protein D9615_010204 [Tricholomella constricta]